jgi:hypothetical protein
VLTVVKGILGSALGLAAAELLADTSVKRAAVPFAPRHFTITKT